MNGWKLRWTSERSIWINRSEPVTQCGNPSKLAAWISSQRPSCLRTVIPSSTGVLIEFDIQHCAGQNLMLLAEKMIESFGCALNDSQFNRKIQIPVCYDERLAPDIREVSRRLNIHLQELIDRHSSVIYNVDTVGFMPGFGYLSSLHESLRLPRKTNPSTRVPAGSVAVAENMTAVYPHQSAGGWHLIGRTPIQLFDPNNHEPAVLRVGDSVCFEQIAFHDFLNLQQETLQQGIVDGEN